MNTGQLVKTIVIDAMNRDPWPVMGLIDFLFEQGYSLERVLLFASRTLHMPRLEVELLMIELGFTEVH